MTACSEKPALRSAYSQERINDRSRAIALGLLALLELELELEIDCLEAQVEMDEEQRRQQQEEEEDLVELWKTKRLIRKLGEARGDGTSVISLMIKPGGQIPLVNKMLTDEMGAATNIKSRANRLSVLAALASAQQKLKLYRQVPRNGLVIFCGSVAAAEDGKEKMINVDFEPFRPISRSLYHCDSRFRVEALEEILEVEDAFGFIVIDGHGCLFGRVSGNRREVLTKFSVDLPKKHGRGGQSALRFARLRLEKRHNYLRKVAETAASCFLADNKVNVKGIVLAGAAGLKNQLATSEMVDPRLRAAVIKIVDVSYGSDNGFAQAINLSRDALADLKLFKERRLLVAFFERIARDDGRFCFGIQDTIAALEQGAVDTLLVWDSLDVERLELRDPRTDRKIVALLRPGQEELPGACGGLDYADLELVGRAPLTEWLVDHRDGFGATLEFVSDSSSDGSQFCLGFGGLGGLLRWQVDFALLEQEQAQAQDPNEGDARVAQDGFDSDADTDDGAINWDDIGF